ncbi:MAG: efflux RND transporter permease subunit [Armatimonadota bacterium]|nr:efflux RND transporter permease subunit [Armatimonadota bacterium]MDR7410554.1 efflux RND transporter permease subunit [Armatimonadota bacterium]MDR7425329.1 efflux RND transporter permease subunit [Armatimonadota bacterium]MDR7440561.1 efflux RND transporter permease subunit [Armatimonadota bacterium]MDR7604196.1 efflux RND transporter permease subunit [Armatimonadota bacterium]
MTRLSIRRPVLVLMGWLALGVIGLRLLAGMPVELLPNIEFPVVSIVTVYPGAGPQEVESAVTKPIEEAVGTVSGVREIQASSQEALSLVLVEFALGTDLNAATGAVREKLEAVRAQLPRDARAPVVQRFSFSAFPILSLSLTSDSRTPQELRELVDDRVRSRLEQVPGVANVEVIGGQVREVQVEVDRDRLQAYGLSLAQFTAGVVQENLNVPAGSLREGGRQLAVRALGEFRSVRELEQVRLAVPGGGSVRVGDVARVRDGVAERTQLSRLNGRESVTLLVRKAADANTITVADAVKRELERVRRLYPDLHVTVANDASTFTREAVNDVFLALLLGVVLASAIVFLFLHDAVNTFIVFLAIPTSLLASFVVIASFGFTLNFFTLLGLSLAIGILVDDSIVVLENIHRHLEGGEPPAEAALNGRSEIGLAAVAITLVDVVVFVPLGLSGGVFGQLLRPFGLTVATVTLASLFAAFTLTPMLAARWLRRRTGQEAPPGLSARLFAPVDRFYTWLDARYEGLLRWALRRRGVVVLLGVLSVVGVFPLAGRLGFEFVPTVDQGVLSVRIELPAGTSLARTAEVASQVEARLRRVPEVEDVITNVGTAGQFAETGPQYASMIVRLKEHRRRRDVEVLRELQNTPETALIPGARVVYSTAQVAGPVRPVEVRVLGDDLTLLARTADRIAERLRAVPGTRDVDVSVRIGRPELQVRVDRERASQLGLSTATVAAVLRTAVEGSVDTQLRLDGDEVPVRVRMVRDGRALRPSDLPDLLVATVGGRPVYVRDVAWVEPALGPTQIDRRNRQRVVTVSANLQPGAFAGNVNQLAARALADIQVPGVVVEFGGQAEQIAEAGGTFLFALGLGVVLVYILLAALFESTFTPFAIMLALPLAWVGGILALLATGKSLSIVSAIGFILLTGLVMKNSILLVDYTNTLRARGLERTEAVLRAGPTRLRPVIMTTLSVVLGSLPVALEFGKGSELRSPLAWAVIGGLTWSTLLTLVVIPVTYTLLDDLRGWAARALRRRPAPAREVAEEAGR